ncbi:MAG: hypothetical protein KAY37_09375 [Phycisphaerae bacterium]|nr:hypothetical protein [Phycisphaerae bacterium]
MKPLSTTRFEKRRQRLNWLAVTALPLLLFCCGCPFAAQEVDGTDGGTTDAANSSLATATALALSPSDDELVFTGSITGSADIDVYELGTLAPGDRLFVDVQRTSQNLDPVAAILDSREYLVAYNDDRAPDGSDLNPQLDIVIRGEQDTYYLAIVAYAGNFTTGEYEATVRVQRTVGVPATRAQVVFLDWNGGDEILVRNVGLFNLRPFSAADVGLPAEQTEAFKDRVQELVEERYAEFNMLVLNSDDQAEPSGSHSTVYFGGQSYAAFAISEQIDTFNEDPNDDAIIFIEGYRDVFNTEPTFEQLAQAVANTAAHEVGHLLGLVHTHDCDGLMDTTCYNERLLQPQEFKTSPLDESVFPFGFQDAEEILGWILGFLGIGERTP